MCTIVVLSRAHPRFPLVVAANRDEFHAREATTPRLLHDAPRAVGGLDVAGGGTWMGATERGFFVGLTNQRTWHGPDRTLRSRGEVALEALRLGSIDAVRAYLVSLDAQRYNAFNLLYGDHAGVDVAYARTERAEIERHALPPGLHVLANDRIGSPEMPRADRAALLARPAVDHDFPQLADVLRGALADHEKPPPERLPIPPPGSLFAPEIVRELSAVCIHTPFYGTRSSTVLAVGDGSVERYLFADGPPCTMPYADVTDLLR